MRIANAVVCQHIAVVCKSSASVSQHQRPLQFPITVSRKLRGDSSIASNGPVFSYAVSIHSRNFSLHDINRHLSFALSRGTYSVH
jgi:hypothetical protein